MVSKGSAGCGSNAASSTGTGCRLNRQAMQQRTAVGRDGSAACIKHHAQNQLKQVHQSTAGASRQKLTPAGGDQRPSGQSARLQPERSAASTQRPLVLLAAAGGCSCTCATGPAGRAAASVPRPCWAVAATCSCSAACSIRCVQQEFAATSQQKFAVLCCVGGWCLPLCRSVATSGPMHPLSEPAPKGRHATARNWMPLSGPAGYIMCVRCSCCPAATNVAPPEAWEPPQQAAGSTSPHARQLHLLCAAAAPTQRKLPRMTPVQAKCCSSCAR